MDKTGSCNAVNITGKMVYKNKQLKKRNLRLRWTRLMTKSQIEAFGALKG